MPQEIYQASGIIVNGRRLKSFVFTTDLAIIRNCDADAVFAVYPFTPQQAISDAIIKYSYVPVFCGVGGGTTRGLRTVQLARDVESQGAMGVVLNAPINNLNLRAVSGVIDIPTVITVTKFDTDLEARIEAGASILNIAAAAQTPELVREARKALPDVPIIATGGKTGESILRTIEAGANAITYTPPSTYELFQEMMKGRELPVIWTANYSTGIAVFRRMLHDYAGGFSDKKMHMFHLSRCGAPQRLFASFRCAGTALRIRRSIPGTEGPLLRDCHVASLLAMTNLWPFPCAQ